MKIIENTTDLKGISRRCVLTIGNFDGVHLGHRRILKAAAKIATERGAEFIVMTFEPHPVAILYPEKAPGVLTPRLLKRHLLEQVGADHRLVLKTTRQVLELSPQEFVQRYLVDNIRPAVVVEGHDFNFGSERSGNIDTLQNLAHDKDFEVVVVDAKMVTLSTGQSVRVSSTMIRYMLESGHAADAAAALGRQYRLIGRIMAGRGRGGKLGFPTLNMERPEQIIPAEGVYAGLVSIADSYEQACAANQKSEAVFSIGQARTFGDEHPLLIEAHLLSKNPGDCKGKIMAMDFVEHIRGQHKFENEHRLAEQIAKDCETAKNILVREITERKD